MRYVDQITRAEAWLIKGIGSSTKDDVRQADARLLFNAYRVGSIERNWFKRSCLDWLPNYQEVTASSGTGLIPFILETMQLSFHGHASSILLGLMTGNRLLRCAFSHAWLAYLGLLISSYWNLVTIQPQQHPFSS